jgi:integrase
MPKPRLAKNKGLPARWRYYHGSYIYRVPPGFEAQWDGKTQFRLGETLPEAFKNFSKRLDQPADNDLHNIGQLLTRYALEVVPTKAPKTQAENNRQIARLRAPFGAMSLTSIKPAHVYKYVDKRNAKTAAHREIEVLSHAFTKAVEWGAIDRHPFKGEVRLAGEPPRTRYVEDWEVQECLSLTPMRKRGSVLMIQAYIRLKLLTGLARSDLLRLRIGEHLRDDGIHVIRHKTKRRATIYTYEQVPERKTAVEEALRMRPALSPFLFCNKHGEGYFNETTGTCAGFDSMWD